jgi:hypothetical protein
MDGPAWATQPNDQPAGPKWAEPKPAALPKWAQAGPSWALKGLHDRPAPPNLPPKTGTGYVEESLSGLMAAPKGLLDQFLEGSGEHYQGAKDTVAEGVARMKSGKPLDIASGVAEDVRGTLSEAASPLAGLYKLLSENVDPGTVLPEAPKLAEVGKPEPKSPIAVEAPAARNVEGRPVVTPKWAQPAEKPDLEGHVDFDKEFAQPKWAEAMKARAAADKPPAETKPAPQEAGSAVTPTHEMLKTNIAELEKQLPKPPGFVDHMKAAGNTLKTMFAPETLDASAGRAAGSLRQEIGRSVRASEQEKASLETYRKFVNGLDTESQLNILKWLQQPEVASQRQAKTGGAFAPSPEIAPFLGAFRDLMLRERVKLESLSKTEQMSFKDDYVTQMWRDPKAAKDLLHTLGPKEGSGGFTKRSVIEDYEAGIRAGLTPVTTDPLEISMRYVENVERYMALNRVFDQAIGDHDIVWRAPEHAPDGWIKLDGRASRYKGAQGQDAYAPPGYAAVYNAFASRQPEGAWGDALGALQKASNSVTAFKLGFSGYHALNMATESVVGGVANAIDELSRGNVAAALKAAGKAPTKWITSAVRGRQMLHDYLHDSGSPEMRKVLQLATDANFRVAGKGRIADEYRFTSLGNFYESFKKGRLKQEMADAGRDVMSRPIVGAARQLVTLAGRTLETVSDPLFKTYIPAIKNGAYYDMVSTWLRQNSAASEAEQVAFARKASDMIDDRFGEMNQDNIFWQRTQKMLAQSAVVSYSYELGTVRMALGATKDFVSAPGKLLHGQNPWTPRLSYAIALPIVIGTMGAAYQYMKTGKAPEGLNDAFHPQTGGQDPMTGKDARAVLPGYMEQFIRGYMDPMGELWGKKNGMYDLLHAAFTGTDWRGDPVAPSTDPVAQRIKDWASFAAGVWEPIQIGQNVKGGTDISRLERFFGVREAPMFATDPKAYARMQQHQKLTADAAKAWHDRNSKIEQEGRKPNFFAKRQFIKAYIASHEHATGGTQ